MWTTSLDGPEIGWRSPTFEARRLQRRLAAVGERNEATPYLADLGWTLDGATIRDLPAANHLSLNDDDLCMGNVRYISGVLTETASSRCPG